MWQVAACILLVALFFACMVLGTTYAVGKDTLVVKCWPVVNMEIAINSIHRIRDTWSPLSSPAASYFGRIEVHYGRGRTCIISPKDKKAFIEHLLSKNKSILTFEVK